MLCPFLTDHILEKIVYPDFDHNQMCKCTAKKAAGKIEMDKKLEGARKKVNKILKRDLPKFLGEAKLDKRTFSEVFDSVQLK